MLEYSFSGCSWGCLFYIGCIKAIHELKKNKDCRVITCSSGCIAGISLLLNKNIDDVKKIYQIMSDDCYKCNTPIGKMSGWLRNGLEMLIKDDNEAISLNNKLTIVYTKFPSLKFIKKNIFESKEDLIKSCLASSFIPIYFTEMVFYDWQLCLDGGIINNHPILSDDTIIFGIGQNDKINIKNSIKVNIFSPPNKINHHHIIMDGYTQTKKYFK